MTPRRVLSLALAAVLAFALILPGQAAESPFTVEDGVLTAYTGPGGRVNVPGGVAALGEGVFAGREDIASVVLPEGLWEIGDRAFAGCSGLWELVLLGEVTRFGAECFAGCVSFNSMAVPVAVTEVGDGAFRGCTALETVRFLGSPALGARAFEDCPALTEVRLTPDMTEFGRDCFGGTPFLVGLGRIAVVNGVLIHCGDDVLHMEVPEGVAVIAPGACADRPRLTKVIIPAWVEEIRDYAFQNCTALTDVYILGKETVIAPTAFDGCPRVTIHSPRNGSGSSYGGDHDLPVTEDVTLPEGELIQAYATAHTVWVDDSQVTFHMYALKNELGYETNYIRVRDLAMLLMDTPAGFAVTWEGEVSLRAHQTYVPEGIELDTPFSGDWPCRHPRTDTVVDGERVAVDAILLMDENNNGYTYYQLRELGRLLGFNVGWTQEKGVFVQTDRPYTDLD